MKVTEHHRVAWWAHLARDGASLDFGLGDWEPLPAKHAFSGGQRIALTGRYRPPGGFSSEGSGRREPTTKAASTLG